MGTWLTNSILDKFKNLLPLKIYLKMLKFFLNLKTKPRKGWAEAFKKMHDCGDDQPLINDIFEDEQVEA
jgi:antitoxin MazE